MRTAGDPAHIFAIVAAMLVSIGLYGVLSTMVRQRTAGMGYAGAGAPRFAPTARAAGMLNQEESEPVMACCG